jgi:hypothetical protein
MGITGGTGWLQRLRERGVIRVAASYAVIAWLSLQIADVTFEPLGVPGTQTAQQGGSGGD